jgi:hypothetical protein
MTCKNVTSLHTLRLLLMVNPRAGHQGDSRIPLMGLCHCPNPSSNWGGSPIDDAVYAIAFEEIFNLVDFRDIAHIKTIKGEDSADRLRSSRNRIGVFIPGVFIPIETVWCARVLHRHEI